MANANDHGNEGLSTSDPATPTGPALPTGGAEDQAASVANAPVADALTEAAPEAEPQVAAQAGPDAAPAGKDEGELLPILIDDVSAIPVWKAPRNNWRTRVLVLLGLGMLFLWNAGSFGLWDPWETHYGEVTQNMIESYDWVSPWWGFKEKIGDEPVNGYNFMSKPIYIFWAEATFVRLIGYSDWAIRIPIALLAIFALFATFIALSKLIGPRVGFFAAFVMATSPQFVMIARQAQTDMPFVATLTIAMMFLLMGVFGKREAMTNRRFLAAMGAVVGFLLLSTLPQFGIIATDLSADPPGRLSGLARAVWILKHNGIYHSLIYLVVELVVLTSIFLPLYKEWKREGDFSDAFKDRWVRNAYLFGFYIMAGHATLAKGLLGFMLPGFILLGFIGLAWEWRILKRLQIGRGVAITAIVTFPWYGAMFAKHGMAFYSRFFVHDHFNRLASGVHAIDSGAFEHFIKWLGIGMFPWAALVPFVFLSIMGYRLRPATREGRLKLMLFLWFFLSYALFTLARTKFHHYIFPALPPLAILTGWWLVDFDAWKGWRRRFVLLTGLALFVTLTVNLTTDVQHIRNLCTYKYDRPMPKSLPINQYAKIKDDTERTWADSRVYKHTNGLTKTLWNAPALEYRYVIPALGALGVLAFLLLAFKVTRRYGNGSLALLALLLLLYTYHYYMPMLAPSWSQKYLFEDYYADCTPAESDEEIVEAYTPLLTKMGMGAIPEFFGATNRRLCEEQVISWLLTWRGETYYTYDTIIPINKEATQFEAYLKEWNRGRPFYVFMQSRGPSYFESKMKTYTGRIKKKYKNDPVWSKIKSWKVTKIHYESHFFTLMKATPVLVGEPDPEPAKKDLVDEAEVKEDVVP